MVVFPSARSLRNNLEIFGLDGGGNGEAFGLHGLSSGLLRSATDQCFWAAGTFALVDAPSQRNAVMTNIAVNMKEGATPKTRPTALSPEISSEVPHADSPMFDFPVLFRGISEASAEQAKENWQIMKSAAEKLTVTARDAYSTTTKESMEYGMKVMETARANTGAALELANALMAAKSPSQLVELSSADARRQLDLIVEQNRQLWAAAQKIATAMLEPLNTESSSTASGRRK